MDTGFQQFFYPNSTDIAHNFPLVKTPESSEASRGTRDYGSMLLWPLPAHTSGKLKAVKPKPRVNSRGKEPSDYQNPYG